jgi:hypothetical protein
MNQSRNGRSAKARGGHVDGLVVGHEAALHHGRVAAGGQREGGQHDLSSLFDVLPDCVASRRRVVEVVIGEGKDRVVTVEVVVRGVV